jgi:[protein-PII] uridylyltransferase
VSEVPTPSDREGTSLDRFLDLRDSLRSQRSGHGGREVCEPLTRGLDLAIAELVDPLPPGVALVAIGGYGRGELSLFSDVDLMVLHELDDPAELASAIFRPLWDAKLRVGHAVRTVKESSQAAKERVDTHTTLLTSRLVTGDEELFARLMVEIASVTRARPLRRHVVSDEVERRRHSPYLLMATDVKTGRGGLRTLHGFDWERRREELIGRFSTDSAAEEGMAREKLLRVRNALHAAAGRAHDVFSPDLREPVARWLGVDEMEAAGWLVEAMETVDHLAARRWPEVLDGGRRGVFGRLRGKAPAPTGPRPPGRAELIWILESGDQGRVALERLWEGSHLDEVLPEWGTVRSLPQLAPFHEHPVAAHLWRTVDEMGRISSEDGPYARIAAEIDAPDLLTLSAFLHDIGKGRGGDHSEIGSELASLICQRLGMSPEETALIEGAVRHHLLLPLTATRRDLDDPAVIDEIAETVGSLRLLQILYLLTVADSRATGPSMWNAWKATLLQTLFVRCAGRYGADRVPEIGTTQDEVSVAVGPDRSDEVASHLAGMPGEYLRSVSADEVVWHLDLIAGLDGGSAVGVRRGDPLHTAVVVGRSRPGFRRHVAETLAANGIDVLEARLLTRDDGVVVDSFRVSDDRTGAAVESAKWDTVRNDLESALLGQLDTGSKLAARVAAYGGGSGNKPAVRGVIDGASGELVVTIKCADRIGRLAEILTVLHDCGLDIGLAKIDSREGEVVDTFHVVGTHGDIDALEHRIASSLSP